MKKIIKIVSVAIISIFTLASCNSNETSSISDSSSVSIEQSDVSDQIDGIHEVGQSYEVGITPDDYNMDYDTSRLKDLSRKKSKYYPADGVKGIYLNTYNISDTEKFNNIMDLLDNTSLNTIVIDIKDDYGNITCQFDTDNEDIIYATSPVIDAKDFIDQMHKKGIYVIGRITTFKDSIITKKHPDWGFKKSDGSLWSNSEGDVFMNPFSDDVRKYDIEIAKLAVQNGFDEIQFDYIRFAEGFETFENTLTYDRGQWQDSDISEGDKRVNAITSFVKKAREDLQVYDIPIGIDVFGYAMQVSRADGIGQDFSEMANETDVVSSMIYPSHWSQNSFDIAKPDLEPYELVKRYLEEEQKVFKDLEYKPQSRPWLQDFTATWIGEGNWQEYTAKQVEEQIKAVYDVGQKEFLLWNASGDYSQGVNY